VVSVLVPVRIAIWVGGKALHRPNLTETTTPVTGHYVSQQHQFALVCLESHAREFRNDAHQELKKTRTTVLRSTGVISRGTPIRVV
jgi:hypothetical protein